MTTERLIQDALQAAGDPGGAFLWRRVCRDLDGDLRIGVIAREEQLAQRVVRALAPEIDAELVVLRLERVGDDAFSPSLGAQDRLLGVHALIWATPATAPMSAGERDGMRAIVEAGAPRRRTIAIADLELIAQMSDEPEREAAEVVERVHALASSDWEVIRAADLLRWVAQTREQHTELIQSRRRTVAGLLLREARRSAAASAEQAETEVQRVEELLAQEDAVLETERRAGQRVAAHILGAMRRETESLLVDLRDFLVTLENDLPGQVEAVPELERIRRTLPHWLHRVVEEWMETRLATWRSRVLEDLAEVHLDEADLDRATLLVPALHPPPMRPDGNWGQRIGVTAAVGGGAAMMVLGYWIPGLLAVTGGIAWSALGQRAAEATNRRALIDAAVEAVRAMGQDADRLLRQQIQALEDELERLGDDRAEAVALDRSLERAELEAQRTARRERARALTDVLTDLDRRIEALGTEVPA